MAFFKDTGFTLDGVPLNLHNGMGGDADWFLWDAQTGGTRTIGLDGQWARWSDDLHCQRHLMKRFATPEEAEAFVYSISDQYKEMSLMSKKPGSWYALLEKLAKADCLGIGKGIHRILLYGPPGTGKSSWPIRYYGADKVSKVIMHKRLQPDEVVGGLLIDETGATKSNPQHAALAMLEGRPLVIDEIDRTSPDVVCLLHAILDDASISRVPLADGRTVAPKEGFMVFATMNAHPDTLPEALRDRFELVLQCVEPAPGIFKGLPKGLAHVLEANIKASPQAAWTPSIGVRPIMAANRLAGTKVFSIHESVEIIFGPKVGKQIGDSIAAQS